MRFHKWVHPAGGRKEMHNEKDGEESSSFKYGLISFVRQ